LRPLVVTLFPYTTLFRSLGFLGRGLLRDLRKVDLGHIGDLVRPDMVLKDWADRDVHERLADAAAIGRRREVVLALRHVLRNLDRDRKSTRLNSSHVSISY